MWRLTIAALLIGHAPVVPQQQNLEIPNTTKPTEIHQPITIKEIKKVKPLKAVQHTEIKPLAKIPVLKEKPLKVAETSHMSRGNSAGNTYGYGYCTWFVKNMRPDLPNNLGNANTWYSQAAAQGMSVGSTPRVGAVATTTRGSLGHVAYVTGVSGGMVTITEMNVQGWNVQSSQTAPASDYLYIY